MSQTLTDIKSLLANHGLRPKHRFGQNFLHDQNHLSLITESAEPGPGGLILEVGPGTGGLTQRLLDRGAHVVAIEIDRDLKPILERSLSRYEDRVTLMFTDVLANKNHINPEVWSTLRDMANGIPSGVLSPITYKLVANLPYNIASPLIVNLLTDDRVPRLTGAVVMVQREIADRLMARPGGKEYGPLGVMVQVICEVERIATLSPSCFWPRPKVESAVVRLTRRIAPMTDDLHGLRRMLRRLFGTRRKQIGTVLGRDHDWPAGVDPSSRPQELEIEQIIALIGVDR